MDVHSKRLPPLTISVRWTARFLSLLSIGIILLFMIGEGFNPRLISSKEWALFLFFPFGVGLGMALSWWNEKIGPALSFGSLFAFYGIHFMLQGIFPHGWAFLLFSCPGFLFLISWYRSRKDPPLVA